MNKKERAFVATVWDFYNQHGRHNLPWRKTKDPYKILVSEIMLQQTQVDRVLPKYKDFIAKYPNAKVLAKAPLSDVLKIWQGLGYNRRAKMLHIAAQEVADTFPRTYQDIQKLSGVGPYTAGAIMAFAYNVPVPIIETNIRTVFLHHFFHDQTDVAEIDILHTATKCLDTDNPRGWYWALMDYGAYLKKQHGNPNSRSSTYTKQSRFVGSNRQIRGAIIRALSIQPHTRKKLLAQLSSFDDIRIDACLVRLAQEGMIEKKRAVYQLAS